MTPNTVTANFGELRGMLESLDRIEMEARIYAGSGHRELAMARAVQAYDAALELCQLADGLARIVEGMAQQAKLIAERTYYVADLSKIYNRVILCG